MNVLRSMERRSKKKEKGKKQKKHFSFLVSSGMSQSLSAGDVSSSLAARNPTSDVIPAHLHPRPKTTNAENIMAEARHQMNGENAAAFHAEIE